MDHESWAFCEAVKPGQVRAIWWGGRDMLSRILLDCAPYLHHLSWPQCNWQSLPSRCSWAMTADHCSAACSNNSHLLQRFVNLDVRHQLELREYHHRVKMETERVSDYLRRSGERPWAHVHMWPLVYSLLIIKPQLVGFMSGSKWCVATLAMMNVMWGKVWLGLGFIYLLVGGSQATRGRIYSPSRFSELPTTLIRHLLRPTIHV